MEKLVVDGIDLSNLVGIRYDASRHPGSVRIDEFLKNPQLGSNCQLLVLGALEKAGFYIGSQIKMDQGERFGSQELWTDKIYTKLLLSVTERPIGILNIDAALYRISLEGCAHEFFNIFFFWPPGWNPLSLPYDYKKMHIGVSVGLIKEEGSDPFILHNAKPGPSNLWTLKDFVANKYFPFGVKRALIKSSYKLSPR